MGGVDLWQNDYEHDDDSFSIQSMHDKTLEVVCVRGAYIYEMIKKLKFCKTGESLFQVGLSQARRLAQGNVLSLFK
ncbi:unnamed protein product [Brassica rapa subsp. trilocularis]